MKVFQIQRVIAPENCENSLHLHLRLKKYLLLFNFISQRSGKWSCIDCSACWELIIQILCLGKTHKNQEECCLHFSLKKKSIICRKEPGKRWGTELFTVRREESNGITLYHSRGISRFSSSQFTNKLLFKVYRYLFIFSFI